MRRLDNGVLGRTEVLCLDEPGEGGACHEYIVAFAEGVSVGGDETPPAQIKFQKGPIGVSGVNGCHNEDLIAIVIDRLKGFQASKFACRENELALTKLEEAMHWLSHRTLSRIKRGVEGTHQV